MFIYNFCTVVSFVNEIVPRNVAPFPACFLRPPFSVELATLCYIRRVLRRLYSCKYCFRRTFQRVFLRGSTKRDRVGARGGYYFHLWGVRGVMKDSCVCISKQITSPRTRCYTLSSKFHYASLCYSRSGDLRPPQVVPRPPQRRPELDMLAVCFIDTYIIPFGDRLKLQNRNGQVICKYIVHPAVLKNRLTSG